MPGPVAYSRNIGTAAKTGYASMAEAAILVLEGRFEPFSTGADVDMDRVSESGKDLFLGINYGGVVLEYIHNSDDVFHWTIHTTIGGGTVSMVEENTHNAVFSDGFYVIEPTLHMDINIAKWFRIGVGVSYFAPIGVQLEDITSSDLSGPTGALVFKFGSF